MEPSLQVVKAVHANPTNEANLRSSPCENGRFFLIFRRIYFPLFDCLDLRLILCLECLVDQPLQLILTGGDMVEDGLLLDGCVLRGSLWNKPTLGAGEGRLTSEGARVPADQLLAEV